MSHLLKKWEIELKNHKKLIFLSIILFIIANILNVMAGDFVDSIPGKVVSDIILDNIPAIDLSFFYIQGITLILIVFFVYPIIYKVKKIHIAISQFSLLLMIRSFFMVLTHLKLPTQAILPTTNAFVSIISFRNDLFFSGHTAVPFLGFLIYKNKKLKLFFLLCTITMMLTVLFMHVHYSIDVFAALFITYGSFELGRKLVCKVQN